MASLTAPHLPERWADTDNEELDVLALGHDNITECETEVGSESDSVPSNLPVTISFEFGTNPLTASTVVHCVELPEYPQSSENGIAYILHTFGRSQAEADNQLQNVQFAHSRKYPIKGSISKILDGAQCTREVATCSGTKICEYLHPQIRNITEATEDNWQIIRKYQMDSFEDNLQKTANSYFLSIRNSFLKKKSCKRATDSCQGSMIQLLDQTASDVPVYAVRCINQTALSKDHLYKIVPTILTPQIPFLLERFRDPPNVNMDRCGMILQMNSRRQTCGIDHLQGAGKVLRQECKVQFNIFRPVDIIKCPYLIFTSHGTHNHLPPPPTKTPKEVMDEILAVISRLNNPNINLNSLLNNTALRDFCQRFDKKSLVEIHQSLANYDKISALIYKQRLLNYPDGQSITGVEFKYYLNHKDNPNAYIQFVYNDGINFIVICFFRQQIELLAQRDSVKMEIGFKRLRNRNEKEIALTGFIPETKKVMTFARIFINQESSEMYTRVMDFFVKLLRDRYQIHLKWQHLHGSGLKAIVVDQDPKQFAGICKYLSSIDPQHRDWHWQMTNSIIFCLVHFQRGIEKLVGRQEHSSTSLYTRMMDLPNCNSKDEYFNLCDLLITSTKSSIDVQNWAMNKKHNLVAAGYNKHYSDIDNTIFDSLREYTKAVELTHLSHHERNSIGRYLSLLQAIDYVQGLDRKDFEQHDGRGINTSSCRVRSMSTRFENTQRRNLAEVERQEQQASGSKRGRLEELHVEDHLSDAISEVSSSGVSRNRSRRRFASPTPSRLPSRMHSSTPTRASRAQFSLLYPDLARRREEAEIRRLELENEKLELEIKQAKQAQRGT